MSELNSNDLPLEILVKVFRYLDGRNLKNATLTCKLWNDLIESACQWSLELDYNDYGKLKLTAQDSEKKMNFILTTNRKFGSIEITNGPLSENNRILKMFQRHGFNIVKLSLCGHRINSLIAFAELLVLTPNLNYLFIKVKNLLSDVTLDQILPDLNKLKTLEMVFCDQQILKVLRKAKLTKILIRENRFQQHYGPLVDFLSSQEMLTSLTADLSFTFFTLLVEMGKLNVPFRLTELVISGMFGEDSSHDHSNLLRFIESQTKTVERMEIGFNVQSCVYEYVFARMTNLDILSVIIDEIPRSNMFYQRMKENGSVRTMKLLDFDLDALDDLQYVGNLLSKLANVRTLILSTDNKYILALTQILTELESLRMDFIMDESVIDYVRFSNLKALHIELLYAKINWNEFTKVHSRLTELVIENMEHESFFTSDDMDQITTNVDLQIIRLGIGFVANDRLFEIIRAKCSNLKVLDLHRSSLSYGTRHNMEINVLRLCDDIKCPKTIASNLFQP
ncbi:uncharacterized protein LOC119071745 [Bradysia coprophila]|uniref:uncharacterized protein LOC119071745 n=1 Tax=Bradysia coprophila TaxID=38358 RepID=UPI00187D76E2|nr:uncharacterized protein LOC119071745 [Bradysia coprophila]